MPRINIVVVVDVGDDFGEADDAGSGREVGGASGHAEGGPLLLTDSSANTRAAGSFTSIHRFTLK